MEPSPVTQRVGQQSTNRLGYIESLVVIRGEVDSAANVSRPWTGILEYQRR